MIEGNVRVVERTTETKARATARKTLLDASSGWRTMPGGGNCGYWSVETGIGFVSGEFWRREEGFIVTLWRMRVW